MKQARTIGTAETATILGRSKDTVIRLIEAGDLPAEKLAGPNGAYVLSEADVLAYKDAEQAKAATA